MLAGRGDLESALGRELAADFGKIRRCLLGESRGIAGIHEFRGARALSGTRGRWQHRFAIEGVAHLAQMAGELELRVADQTRFERIGEGQNQLSFGAGAFDERRQQLGGLTQLAPERQLAVELAALERARRYFPAGGQDADGDGQVKAPAFLG